MTDKTEPTIADVYPDLVKASVALNEIGRKLQGLRMTTADDIQAIKAAAWDEGFTARSGEHMKQSQDPTYPITRTNPYIA